MQDFLTSLKIIHMMSNLDIHENNVYFFLFIYFWLSDQACSKKHIYRTYVCFKGKAGIKMGKTGLSKLTY